MSYLNAFQNCFDPFQGIIDKIWSFAAPWMDLMSFKILRFRNRNTLTRLAVFAELVSFKLFLLRYGNRITIELWVKLGFR